MKVGSCTVFRTLFQLDWLGVLLATRGISIRALCAGVKFAVVAPIFPPVPRAGHWFSNSLTHAATCSEATIQQYDIAASSFRGCVRPFGCAIASTKEEDVLIDIWYDSISPLKYTWR